MASSDAPLLYNKVHSTRPAVVHAPGKLAESPWWEPIKAALFASPAKYAAIPSLAIVTWNSGAPDPILRVRGHTLGWFETSLTHAGLEATVLGGHLGSAWTNRHKLDLTIEFLTTCSREYVLGADSSDALLVGDPGDLLERYRAYEGAIVFNAERHFWPPELKELRAFEDRIGRRPFRYLNSGVWIGRRAVCLEAFRAARRWADRLGERRTSDQVCWKYAYRDLYPTIVIDDRCTMFQNLNRVRRGLRVRGQSLPFLTAWGASRIGRP